MVIGIALLIEGLFFMQKKIKKCLTGNILAPIIKS